MKKSTCTEFCTRGPQMTDKTRACQAVAFPYSAVLAYTNQISVSGLLGSGRGPWLSAVWAASWDKWHHTLVQIMQGYISFVIYQEELLGHCLVTLNLLQCTSELDTLKQSHLECLAICLSTDEPCTYIIVWWIGKSWQHSSVPLQVTYYCPLG